MGGFLDWKLESVLRTPALSSVLKYRDLEPHESSKVTQAAQGTVAKSESLSAGESLNTDTRNCNGS